MTDNKTKPEVALSIRYDLGFSECLVRFADAVLAPESNPGGDGPTPCQEQAQSESYKMLTDCIDGFCQRYAQAQLKDAQAKMKAGN